MSSHRPFRRAIGFKLRTACWAVLFKSDISHLLSDNIFAAGEDGACLLHKYGLKGKETIDQR